MRIIYFLFTLAFALLTFSGTQVWLKAAVGAGMQVSGSRSITGRVVTDTGQPLANVFIFARLAGGSTRTIQSIVTDEDGRFQIADLSPGAYTVSARTPGYIDLTNPLLEGKEGNYYRPGDSVTIQMVKGGVITGKVTDSAGEPLATAPIRAIRVRDTNGRLIHSTETGGGGMTDDRGIYRLYGLQPGSYLIHTGGNLQFFLPPRPYDGDAPTYYPSAGRSNAKEIVVHAGEEVTGIDIRHRGEKGRSISGNVSGSLGTSSPINTFSIMLANASSGAVEATIYIPGNATERAFAFYGVSDGEYELIAQRGLVTEDGATSNPRRVIVKGADVTGVELTLLQLASIKGRVLLDPQQAGNRTDCAGSRGGLLAEVVLLARRDERTDSKDQTISRLPSTPDALPNEKGDFALRNLEAGRYRLGAKLPGEDLYIRSITLTGNTPAKEPNDIASHGLALKLGDRVTGLNVTIAEGAAGIRGRVVPAVEGEQLPPLRIHLVPAEREQADNAFRYAEVEVRNGEFEFKNIAPGQYWILARVETETDRPIAWDSEGRAMLRREATAANIAIELQSCGRVTDYELRYKK